LGAVNESPLATTHHRGEERQTENGSRGMLEAPRTTVREKVVGGGGDGDDGIRGTAGAGVTWLPR